MSFLRRQESRENLTIVILSVSEESIEMPEEKSWHCSVVYKNKIYIIGGTHWWDASPVQNIRDSLTTVYEYAPDDINFSISPQDKLSSTWGNIKSIE